MASLSLPPAPSEATPLRPPPPDDPDRPLRKGQIVILCIARVCEPLAFFSIFAFVQQQVNDLGAPEADVGFYTGLIVRLFFSGLNLLFPN